MRRWTNVALDKLGVSLSSTELPLPPATPPAADHVSRRARLRVGGRALEARAAVPECLPSGTVLRCRA